MQNAVFAIQEEPIPDAMLLAPSGSEGARIVFVGLVRDYNQSKSGVTRIEYHCYRELAEPEGSRILVRALEDFEIDRVHCIHRVGLLSLQEIAIRLEIGSGHRLPALRACEYIMDQIKLHVPIWKKEFYRDGDGEWL